MNSFGTLFTVQIFGASHGASVGVIIDGVPPGLSIDAEDFLIDLKRRQGDSQLGTTPRREDDFPNFLSGVFNGYATGAPLMISFENNNIKSEDYSKMRAIPRPGHADFVAHEKYKGFEDYRGSGHFSARLTVGIVAAGVIAKKILGSHITINAKVASIAGNENIEAAIAQAIEDQDSVGGIIECVADGLPIGLGAPFWDSVESLIAHACFSIPAVKGIAFGSGFEAANMKGSQHNDALIDDKGTTATNNAGGIVGGLTNGNQLKFQIAIKPTSSTPKLQTSFNWDEGKMETFAVKGRHDLCVALRAPVIVEAMTAIVLCDLMMQNRALEFSPKK